MQCFHHKMIKYLLQTGGVGPGVNWKPIIEWVGGWVYNHEVRMERLWNFRGTRVMGWWCNNNRVLLYVNSEVRR